MKTEDNPNKILFKKVIWINLISFLIAGAYFAICILGEAYTYSIMHDILYYSKIFGPILSLSFYLFLIITIVIFVYIIRALVKKESLEKRNLLWWALVIEIILPIIILLILFGAMIMHGIANWPNFLS